MMTSRRSQLTEACRAIRSGQRTAVLWNGRSAQPPPGLLVFPGSFNPLHEGHQLMAEMAARLKGQRPVFEISLVNVDKPPLSATTLRGRVAQFASDTPVWLTAAATFAEKAKLFPQATFIVGADTMARVGAARYHAHNVRQLDSALRTIADCGCHFLVFGRATAHGFRTLSELELPATLMAISEEVSENQFRMDLSSTEVRQGRDGRQRDSG